MSDIVERLRAKELLSIEEDGYTHFLPKNPDGDDDADEITRLRTENEKLRRAMHDIYEVYAGYDGILIETSRDYLKHLIIEMSKIAAEHKNGRD